MGRKKKRQRTPSNSPVKISKQLRLDDIMNLRVAETVSDLAKHTTSNKFSLLAEDSLAADPQRSTENVIKNLPAPHDVKEIRTAFENKLCLLEGDLKGDLSEALAGQRQNTVGIELHQIWEQLGEHCIITGKTVLAIFGKLQHISDQLAILQKDLTQKEKGSPYHHLTPPYLTQEKGKELNPGGHRRIGQPSETNKINAPVSRRLLVSQIILEVTNNYINKGKWVNRKKVLNSLSKLLRTEVNQIDLKNLVNLPAPYYKTRLQLEFYKPTIPLMLFRMKGFLNTFSIATKRVFSNVDTATSLPRCDLEELSVLPTPLLTTTTAPTGQFPRQNLAEKPPGKRTQGLHQATTMTNLDESAAPGKLESLTKCLENSLVNLKSMSNAYDQMTKVQENQDPDGPSQKSQCQAFRDPTMDQELTFNQQPDSQSASTFCTNHVQKVQEKEDSEVSTKDLLFQLDIDGDELKGEATTAFKGLPRLEQLEIITNLDKVRAELIGNMEPNIPSPADYIEDESNPSDLRPLVEVCLPHVAPQTSLGLTQHWVPVEVHHHTTCEKEGETETHMRGSVPGGFDPPDTSTTHSLVPNLDLSTGLRNGDCMELTKPLPNRAQAQGSNKDCHPVDRGMHAIRDHGEFAQAIIPLQWNDTEEHRKNKETGLAQAMQKSQKN